MHIDLNHSDRHYLRFLVRQDLKKRSKASTKLAPFPGQDPAEFEQFRAGVVGKIPFIESVLNKLEVVDGND